MRRAEKEAKVICQKGRGEIFWRHCGSGDSTASLLIRSVDQFLAALVYIPKYSRYLLLIIVE